MADTATNPFIGRAGILEEFGTDNDGRRIFGGPFFDNVIRRDHRFPRPVQERVKGRREVYGRQPVREYFERVAREGFPTEAETRNARVRGAA